MRGYETVEATLVSLAAAGQFQRFMDTLFEVESAVHIRDNFPGAFVEFGTEAHPDLWVNIDHGSRVIRHPCECKRIEPIDQVQQQQDQLLADLETGLGAATSDPLKVLVDLHCPAEEVEARDLVQHVVQLLTTVEHTDTAWVTASDDDGRYQITLQPLGNLAMLKRRPVKVPDIEPCGSMIVRAKTVYEGSAQDPTALTMLLRVRNDRLPDRVGAFERNLFKAISQLDKTADQGAPGLATVRLRPPRGLGDLYEADRIVRRVLRDQEAFHVALVMLVWNEGEDDQSLGPANERHRTVAYHLQPHFVTNPRSRVRFDLIDSGRGRFPATPHPMLRDPGSGELTPIDVGFLESPENRFEVREGEPAATLYVQLQEPFDGRPRGPFPRYVSYDDRKIAVTFVDDFSLKCFEMLDGHFSHVATVDLRGWIGEDDLAVVVGWQKVGFEIRVPKPGGKGEVLVRSTPVRGVFI